MQTTPDQSPGASPAEARPVFLMELHRRRLTAKATLGDLHVEGAFLCHTLEDVVRDLGPDGAGKVFGETAIPAGTYEVAITFSPKFGRPMPILLDVPFFTGIRIHSGNTDANTEGCVLLGMEIGGDDLLVHSQVAFGSFYPLLWEAFTSGRPCRITISDEFEAAP